MGYCTIKYMDFVIFMKWLLIRCVAFVWVEWRERASGSWASYI